MLENCATLPVDERGCVGENGVAGGTDEQDVTATTTLRGSDSLASATGASPAPSFPNVHAVRVQQRRDALLSASRCESVVSECSELESEVSALRYVRCADLQKTLTPDAEQIF